MGTKGTTVNSTIFNNKQIMKNQESLGPVIKAAGNGMQRGMSHGADSNGIGRYANGGSYSPAKMMKNQGEGVGNETNNLLEDNPVAETMSGSYSNPGNIKSNPSSGGEQYYPGLKNIGPGGGASNSSSTGSSSTSLDNIRAAQDVLKSPRGVSITNYESGKARADVGRASKASGKAGYGRGQAHVAAGTSMSDYRAAKKTANKEIRAGKKEMRQANKKSVTFDGAGGKTVINNRKQNLRDLNSGTKVGNALRGLFGKGNR